MNKKPGRPLVPSLLGVELLREGLGAATLIQDKRLPVDLVEILNKVTPNEDEVKKFGQFQKDKKDPKTLPDNDRFVFEVREAIACCR